MHKVFHHSSRALAQFRSFDKAARRLRFKQYEQDLLITKRPFSQMCSYPDYCVYVNNKDKHKLLINGNCDSNSFLPQITPKLLYSSGKNDKSQLQSEDAEEKLKKEGNVGAVEPSAEEKKLSIFQRFKQMYRDYWYVLVPVHVATSFGWFGGFYYLAKSGVDILTIVEALGVSNSIPDVLKDSSAGYLAVAYALYKIATPVRYMVTIGGTTISINYLKEYGYIKPIPPAGKLKEMYQVKKENLKEKGQHFADELKQKREQLKGRSQHLADELKQKREQLKGRSQHLADELKQKKEQFKGRSSTLIRDRRQQAQK